MVQDTKHDGTEQGGLARPAYGCYLHTRSRDHALASHHPGRCVRHCCTQFASPQYHRVHGTSTPDLVTAFSSDATPSWRRTSSATDAFDMAATRPVADCVCMMSPFVQWSGSSSKFFDQTDPVLAFESLFLVEPGSGYARPDQLRAPANLCCRESNNDQATNRM